MEMSFTVSIIVPCLNEEKRISTLLDALFSQTYARSLLDVTIADGGSTDHTLDSIASFQRSHPDLRVQVVQNKVGSIPAALNRAIEASSGEIILRLDAHSAPNPDYVERSVAALTAGKGANVGGVWEIRAGAGTWIARSISAAAAHPLAVGDASYRHATQPAHVDTVPFGCYHRSLIEKIGNYDESLLANEDYELNARIRKSGGLVWLDPAIRSVYFARPNFKALSVQYFRYGFWKLKMLRRYPDTIRWRQALPPVFVASLLVCLVLMLFWQPFAWILLFELLAYLLTLILVSSQIALKRKEYFLIAGLPIAISVMHITWGGGFLWSVFSEIRNP